MALAEDDDPFDWEIDRVVQELCTSDRSWTPTPRAKLPDPEYLAQKLIEGEYDGETLLATPEDDLWKDLRITKAKFRVNIRHAIAQFVLRSPKYRKYLASLKDQDADSIAETTEAPQQAFTPMSDTSVPAPVPVIVHPVETIENGVGTPHIDEHPDEPPKKKVKRLEISAMTTTSRPANADQAFNAAPLPTELDTIKHSLEVTARPSQQREVAEALPFDSEMDIRQCESSPGAYWGNGRLPRSGIIKASTFTDNDVSFGWGRPRCIGRAKKKYVADKLKAYLRRPKQAVDDKANDILPVYGQSDDEEYFSELEKLMEEEELEEQEADQDLGLLGASQIDEIIKQMVDACTAHWHEKQLPKENHKAYKMWKDVRRHSTRASTVKAMSEELWKGRSRLEKTLAQMKDNQYKTESELRGMSDFLQPDVDKIEHIKWLIAVLNSPHAPERIVHPKAPSQKKPKTRRKDDIDLWSDDELEEEMRDFIVEDDPYEDIARREQPLDHQEDDDDKVVEVSVVAQNASGSFMSRASEDIEMHDLTHIDDTPFRNRGHTVIDLITPTKPKRGPATPRKPGNFAKQAVSPIDEKFPLSDPKAIANKGSLHWEKRRDIERLIVTNFSNLQPSRRRDVFDSIITLQSEDNPTNVLWKDYIEYACDHFQRAGDWAKGSREKNRYETAAVLTRQFGIYLNKHSGEVTIFKSHVNGPALMEYLQAGKAHLPEFFDLLKQLAPCFGFKEEKDEPVSTDEEEDAPRASDATIPKTKREPAGSSQDVRKRERRRQKEQMQRRMQLRQQVQGSQLPSEKSRLIINESKLEDQNLIYIHDHIAGRIKDHQIDGVRFMWDQLLSDTKQGCLLAHTMGLGKTMQVITLLTAIQEAAKSKDPKISCQIPDHLKVSKTLILCTASVVQNWVEELLMWAPEGVLWPINSVSSDMPEDERTERIQEWAEDGGVLVIGYGMFISVTSREDLRSLILESPSIVISDEAHHLKNEGSKRSEIARQFRTHSRIALTGSPLANNVDEYYAMIEWVAPGFLGDKKWFNSEYSSPISDGLYEDSSGAQRRKAKIRLAALTRIVEPKVQRKTVGTLKDSLPPKTEYIVYLDIRNVQRAVYLFYLDAVRGMKGTEDNQSTLMWALIKNLGLLLAHPLIFERVLRRKLQGSGQPESNNFGNSNESEDTSAVVSYQAASATLDALAAHQGYTDLKSSFKMLALFKIIEETTKLGEKILVFTQSIPSLDFIETICRQKKLLYKRLDGKTGVNKRQQQVKAFNEGNGQVYLISTTAGGVGLNIYGASRVVIFDFQFNPTHEQQAIGRAYRIGQTRPVVVYWLICDGTFEKTLHNGQVFKNQLASRVVDKKNPLPKAKSLREYFTEPQQVEHQDTTKYLGRDVILDALLQSEDTREGISSINTTETFEEEDTQKLEADEIAQAHELALQISRKNNPAEETLIGMPPQPSGQVREVPVSPSSHTFDFAALFSPALPLSQSVTAQVPASTALPLRGQAATAPTKPDARTGSVPPLSLLEYGSSAAAQYRPMSLPPEFLSISASSLMDLEFTANDPNADFLAQAVPTIPAAPGTAGPFDGHQYNFYQPGLAVPGEYGQSLHQHHGSNGPDDFSNPRDDLAPRVLARDEPSRDDPFIDFGPRHSPSGAAAAHGLARADVESKMLPVSMKTSQSGSTPMIAADSGRPRALRDMLPSSIFGMQRQPISGAASPDSTTIESNRPMGLESAMSRPFASSGTRHDAQGEFREELRKQASFPLKKDVAKITDQIGKHIKGGGLVKNSTWTRLTALIRNRQDHADAILSGTISAQTLATANDPKSGLGSLLDGLSSIRQPRDEKRKKDPDHPQRFLQRSMSGDNQSFSENSQKEKDMAVLREVWQNRKSYPQDGPQKQPKVKTEKADRRPETMPSDRRGKSASDPFIIDD